MKPTKSTWIIVIYVLFIAIGIIGIITGRKGDVINSFDLLMGTYYLIFIPLAAVLSILLFHVFFRFNAFKELPLFGKILIHLMSTALISWGIAGGASLINDSQSKHEVIPIEILDKYEKAPKNDYKYSYSYSRYFIVCKVIETGEECTIQVSEGLYENLLAQKQMMEYGTLDLSGLNEETKAFIQANDIPLPKQPKDVILRVKTGLLGIWI
jgi:hypothetical protein